MIHGYPDQSRPYAFSVFCIFYDYLSVIIIEICILCVSVATDGKDEEIKVPKRLFLGRYCLLKKQNPLKPSLVVVHLPLQQRGNFQVQRGKILPLCIFKFNLLCRVPIPILSVLVLLSRAFQFKLGEKKCT